MPPPHPLSLLLVLVLVLLPSTLSQPVLLGQLSTRFHNVSGTVFALNSRQLRITDLYYDGTGPAAVFYTGTGDVDASGTLVPFLDCTVSQKLPPYSGDTVELELPDALQLQDIDYISVWCEAASQDFGSLRIVADDLDSVEPLPQPQCAEEPPVPFPVPDRWNCEPLSDRFHVRWRVDQQLLRVELLARLANAEYMGFGVSGSDVATDMVGSDVAIAYRDGDSFSAVDFFMSTRAPCTDGVGVCPDTDIEPEPGANDILDASGQADQGLTLISYTRPLAAADPTLDRPISTDAPTFISWAIGPLDPDDMLPIFHQGETNFPSANVSIEFARSVADNCPPLAAGAQDSEPVPGFLRPAISNATEITARIGPPGGSRGYSGISGRPGWGFAWYMSRTGTSGEDVLIPAIAVERGKTYRFSVQGGVDEDATYHPLYITDSPVGGYARRTPAERAMETVYAGVTGIERDEDGNVIAFQPTATGELCNIVSTLEGDTAELRTWEEYASTLDLSCANDPAIQEGAGTLEWTVPMDAPDLLYYQCITHQFLGWKLVVFDEGEVDEARLQRENGGGMQGEGECVVTFKGEQRQFGGCQRSLEGGVQVYWTVRENDGEIDTLFRARTGGGFVGWGWGYTEMVGSNAAIAFQGPNGAEIRDYSLEAKSTAGVQPNNNQQLINMDAEVSDDGYVAGIFTRSLEVEGLPRLTPNGTVDVIWALGGVPDSATTLQAHERNRRWIGRLDLRGSGIEVGSAGLSGYFTAHAALMIVGWLGLTPAAVLLMRYFKGWNPTTFQLHRGLNVLSVLVVIAGYIMGLVRGTRSEVAHLVLGSVAIGLAVTQVVSGTLRPGKDSGVRKWFNIGHGVVGYTALHLGMANALLGMILFDVRVGWFVAWGVLVGLYVLGHVLLTVFRKKVPSVDSTSPKTESESPAS